jgi:hypothetical protein
MLTQQGWLVLGPALCIIDGDGVCGWVGSVLVVGGSVLLS